MRQYDESDAKVRPSKRGSRPRSKRRPEHADAVLGTVVGVDRGRIRIMVDGVPVTGIKARELGRRGIVIGDRVGVVGDSSGDKDTLARIVRREERTTSLRRTADDTDPKERVIVANADQLAVVTALADPEPNARMIDRCVVAAYDAGMKVLLVLTKSDLASADALRAAYEPLDVTILETSVTADGVEGIEELRAQIEGLMTVFVGYSGVGKSTLVNALVPTADRAVGIVNDVTGRGRHTSTSAVSLELEPSGRIIDTPGIRSFGLAHVDPAHLLQAFDDVAAAADACPRGCLHASAAEGCELDAWADTEDRRVRVDSIRRLIISRSATDTL